MTTFLSLLLLAGIVLGLYFGIKVISDADTKRLEEEHHKQFAQQQLSDQEDARIEQLRQANEAAYYAKLAQKRANSATTVMPLTPPTNKASDTLPMPVFDGKNRPNN